MPNIIVAPLDFTALSTAPVEESVWPKSPATPKEKVGVAAAAVGLPQRPGAMAASPTSTSARRTTTGRRSRSRPGGARSARPLTVHTSRSSACGRTESHGAEPDGQTAAVVRRGHPRSRITGQRWQRTGGGVDAEQHGLRAVDAVTTPHVGGPDRAPVHQPGPLRMTTVGLAVAGGVPTDVPGDGPGGPPLAATALPTAIPVSWIARAMPHAPPSAGSWVTLPPLSQATGVKWSLAWELPTTTPLLLTP